MVKIDKNYTFQSLDGNKVSLSDIFGQHKQLIIYHFMFGPNADVGCPHCSHLAANLPDTRLLATRNTSFACISRGDPVKIAAYRERCEWQFPWYSSLDSDFNYDFNVTMDENVAPLYYNFRDKEETIERGLEIRNPKGELHGLSVFYKEGDDVYHTYSTYARGVEKLLTTYMMLDITPLGRQSTPTPFPRPYELK